jgi:hypothetical protein
LDKSVGYRHVGEMKSNNLPPVKNNNIIQNIVRKLLLATMPYHPTSSNQLTKEMNNLYGSFTRAFYTFFEITHSGSWPSRVRPVLEKVSPWYSVLFLPYIALVPWISGVDLGMLRLLSYETPIW